MTLAPLEIPPAAERRQKTCEWCGLPYTPECPPYYKRWHRYRFCGYRCSNSSRAATRERLAMERDLTTREIEKELIGYVDGVPVYRVQMEGMVRG